MEDRINRTHKYLRRLLDPSHVMRGGSPRHRTSGLFLRKSHGAQGKALNMSAGRRDTAPPSSAQRPVHPLSSFEDLVAARRSLQLFPSNRPLRQAAGNELEALASPAARLKWVAPEPDPALFSTLRHARLNGQRLKVARPLGAAQQLTKGRLPRLDPKFRVGIKRSVQTKKPPQMWSGSQSRSNPHHPAICTKS